MYKRATIAKRYLATWFVPDVLATMPIASLMGLFINTMGSNNSLQSVKLLRCHCCCAVSPFDRAWCCAVHPSEYFEEGFSSVCSIRQTTKELFAYCVLAKHEKPVQPPAAQSRAFLPSLWSPKTSQTQLFVQNPSGGWPISGANRSRHAFVPL